MLDPSDECLEQLSPHDGGIRRCLRDVMALMEAVPDHRVLDGTVPSTAPPDDQHRPV